MARPNDPRKRDVPIVSDIYARLVLLDIGAAICSIL